MPSANARELSHLDSRVNLAVVTLVVVEGNGVDFAVDLGRPEQAGGRVLPTGQNY
jgi:hypothetical protein